MNSSALQIFMFSKQVYLSLQQRRLIVIINCNGLQLF